MKVTWILLLIIVAISIITSKRKHERFAFLNALLFLLVIISTLFFIIIVAIAYFFSNSIPHLAIGSIFFLYGLIIVIAGILLFFNLQILNHFHRISGTTLTLIEYYIQWSLIYVTIYQILFDNLLKTLKIIRDVSSFTTISTNLILIAVLSSFIASWIGVIFFKFTSEEI
ncbi:hypothetical protein H5993_01895 [Lactobacillus alvi]|uniref:DUF4199 domain-containing protein n=1 Tax=Limosilactobacillus alvi TaxID=990412 RepID=A0ABS2EMR2_9LACO|nr:hypothetical protein [Limosilactobacillus alvi]MBM6753521.1 hypothetical protein [Limosilactobacillus alvi]